MELRPHRLTAMINRVVFGENQLLQRSISFSLQPTSHPKMLNNLRVRPSRSLSKTFSLLMGSSRCFGSDMFYYMRAINTRFRCGSIRKDLASRTHQLVGSFFNRHAVVVAPRFARRNPPTIADLTRTTPKKCDGISFCVILRSFCVFCGSFRTE